MKTFHLFLVLLEKLYEGKYALFNVIKGYMAQNTLEIDMEQFEVSFRNNWDKPIHRWYRFHAGCSFEFPGRMIKTLQVNQKTMIFDPFSGSGTTLICAKERGINSIGVDINPFYVFIASVKTYWEFDIEHLSDFIGSLMTEVKILFEERTCHCDEESESVVNNIPQYIWRYFTPEVLSELSILKRRILKIEVERIRDFFLLALASILIDVSKVHYVGETIVFDKCPKKDISLYQIYVQRIWEMYSDLKTKQHIHEKGKVEVTRSDVRNLNNLISDNSIGHVITHPPYLNNYNYLLHDRLPLYFLEYFKTPSDEKKMRDSILGSVTKNKVTQNFMPVTGAVEKIAQRIKKTGDVERYKAVLEYFDTMNTFLETLFQKLKRNGYCAMLLGNSYVRGVMIPLDVLIARMGRKIGFQIVEVFKVRDRRDGAFQHLYNGKLYESVVLLKRK